MDRLTSFYDYLTVQRHEENFVDSLYFRFSPRIFVMFALIILTKEYIGQPIQCWGNAEWTTSYEQYANDYCFVEGTYYVDIDKPLDRVNDRYKHYTAVDYYPWLPFLLAFMAIVCYIPYFFWSAFNHKSGLAIKAFNSVAYSAANSDDFTLETKHRTSISRLIYNSLSIARNSITTPMFSFMKPIKTFYRRYIGSYVLVLMYLSMKVANIAFAFLQVKFISTYLGKTGNFWDFGALTGTIINERTWKDTGHFPRVGMCDFDVRGLESNIERYTVQCVLMANMINEKIFLAVWWWLWILIACGARDLFQWLFFLFWPDRAFKFIFNSIIAGNAANEERILRDIETKREELKKKVEDAEEIIEYVNLQLPSQILSHRELDRNIITTRGQKAIDSCFDAYETYQCDRRVKDSFMNFLGLDGILFFRLMILNSSSPVASELLSQLYCDFVRVRMNKLKVIAPGKDSESVGVGSRLTSVNSQ